MRQYSATDQAGISWLGQTMRAVDRDSSLKSWSIHPKKYCRDPLQVMPISHKGDFIMADCECLNGCIFFQDKMEKKPATAELMKKRYCHGDNSICARYAVLQELGNLKVPADLFPGDLQKAKAIMSSQ
jgi:hypothetical protein